MRSEEPNLFLNSEKTILSIEEDQAWEGLEDMAEAIRQAAMEAAVDTEMVLQAMEAEEATVVANLTVAIAMEEHHLTEEDKVAHRQDTVVAVLEAAWAAPTTREPYSWATSGST